MQLKNFNHLFMTAMLILATTMSIDVKARPVSYAGGWSTMTMNDGDTNSINIQYSPTSRYSYGYTGEYQRNNSVIRHVMQLNYLAKRWNNPDSQGNFYIESGLGLSDHDSQLNPVGFVGITTDWENRRFLVSYRNQASLGQDIDESFVQWGRVGIAPYIGDYGDLHTWLMIETRYSPESSDSLTVTPFVRLFQDTNMIEMGVSNQGKVMFNIMKQF